MLFRSYREAAKGLLLLPPNTIHQVTEALEQIMAEDAAAARPFIAAMVISKWRRQRPQNTVVSEPLIQIETGNPP